GNGPEGFLPADAAALPALVSARQYEAVRSAAVAAAPGDARSTRSLAEPLARWQRGSSASPRDAVVPRAGGPRLLVPVLPFAEPARQLCSSRELQQAGLSLIAS